MAWARNPFDHVLGREMDSGLDACASPRNDDGETMQSVRLRENRLARRANVPQLISPPNQWLSLPVSFPQEGRLAIVTDVGYGMRWTR